MAVSVDVYSVRVTKQTESGGLSGVITLYRKLLSTPEQLKGYYARLWLPPSEFSQALTSSYWQIVNKIGLITERQGFLFFTYNCCGGTKTVFLSKEFQVCAWLGEDPAKLHSSLLISQSAIDWSIRKCLMAYAKT